jgi:DNA processing protein
VEAKEKSGSLITADFALEQGKTVYAVPGPVTSALSRGCNHLIRQGAEIYLSSGELLEDLRMEREIYINNYQKSDSVLEKREKLVYSCLDLVPRTIDEIHRKSKLDVSETVAVLTSLVIKDYAEVLSRNYYVRKEKC